MAPEDSAWQAMPHFSEVGCTIIGWGSLPFYGQTWYPKFKGTYLPLASLKGNDKSQKY